MVKLKFIVKNGSLVLRISENKERYYKSVQPFLVGAPNIEKHWSDEKEKFSSYAVNYVENNKMIDRLDEIRSDEQNSKTGNSMQDAIDRMDEFVRSVETVKGEIEKMAGGK